MREFIKSLFYPLSLAGLLAWGAIGFELLWGNPATTDWLSSPTPVALIAALHLGFLAFFIWPQKNRGVVLAQLFIALLLMLLVRAGSLPILLIIVMAQVAQSWPTRVAAGIFIACNIAVYFIYARIWGFSSPLVMTLMYMSFQGFAAITSWYAFTAESTRDALAAINAELVGTRSLLDASIRDSERLRISRELHDVAGHKLTALKLNLKAMQRDPAFSDSQPLQIAAELSDELLQDIRAVVQQLRMHDGIDLHAGIVQLAQAYPRPKLHVELPNTPHPEVLANLPASLRVTLFSHAEAVLRMAQEALTNAARHSSAENLWIRITPVNGFLQIDIHDDGRIANTPIAGSGLTGMRERLEALGGSLHFERSDKGNMRLIGRLPLPAEALP